MDELSKEVSDVMCRRLQIDNIEDEKDWEREFQSLDSLDLIDLIFVLEDEFRVKFPDKIKNASFRHLVEFIGINRVSH
jgi:acyl carrier protein